MASEQRCWTEELDDQLSGSDREIAAMLLEGPEADEYTDEDVWRGMTALLVDVTRDQVADHRARRCSCRTKGDA